MTATDETTGIPRSENTDTTEATGATGATGTTRAAATAASDDAGSPRTTLRLGFARGVAPSKWVRRWAEATAGMGAPRLEIVPLPIGGRWPRDLDVVLERVAPGADPVETTGEAPSRHAVRLYTESLALVVPADHELAAADAADQDSLELVPLLAHPGHAPAWPAPQPWADPSWAPRDAAAALELVATGLGAILLPLPLARHLVSKRAHTVLPLRVDPPLPGTTIWASWAIDRDAADVQQLVGIMRGRTARSARPDAMSGQDPEAANGLGQRGARRSGGTNPQAISRPKKALPKNSRGAQLAAAKAKAEVKKRAKAQEKKRRRR